MGSGGIGKSTSAAIFARMGLPVLTDDVLALRDRETAFDVQPGLPRVLLWSESVRALFGDAEALPRIVGGWDKRYLDLTQQSGRFETEPRPLAAIFLLHERCDDPGAPFVESIPRAEALMSLIANTYATKLMDKQMRAREFELLSRLLTRVPLRRVTPHASPDRIPELCDSILLHV